MDIIYVLNETESNGCINTIGVFDSPVITNKTLRKYYGSTMKMVESKDIHDSGLEWTRELLVEGETVSLVLHYFNLNDL